MGGVVREARGLMLTHGGARAGGRAIIVAPVGGRPRVDAVEAPRSIALRAAGAHVARAEGGEWWGAACLLDGLVELNDAVCLDRSDPRVSSQ